MASNSKDEIKTIEAKEAQGADLFAILIDKHGVIVAACVSCWCITNTTHF